MYGKILEERYTEYKFLAALQGVDLDKESGTKGPSKIEQQSNQNPFAFKDPQEYENMTSEEREDLTRKMMGEHKKWVGEHVQEDLGKG